MNYQDVLKTEFLDKALDEVWVSDPSVLLGVSDATTHALRLLEIRNVFDLATSRVFNNAWNLCNATPDSLFARYGIVPSDVIRDGDTIADIAEVYQLPIDRLDGIGSHNAPVIQQAMNVRAIRDLAHWPPFVAVRQLVVNETRERERFDDPEIPNELVPQFNDFPTEKVFYSVYLIDDISKDTKNLLDLDGPIDLSKITVDSKYLKLRTGYVVRYEQSWTTIGLALGNLLHSTTLAPGESTRIAVVDWTRRQGVKTTEDISQLEALSNSLMQTRSISEVTSAVAREAQSGFSQMNANSTVSNNAYSSYGVQNPGQTLAAMAGGAAIGGGAGAAAGGVAGAGIGLVGALAGGVGVVPGVLAGGAIGAGTGAIIGGTAGGVGAGLATAKLGARSDNQSNTTVDVVTTTSSTGQREMSSSLAQNIMDRTQQHSSSSRNKKASIVQEIRQEEKEQITTRVMTNYNHMHAMTMNYFEVVQLYSVKVRAVELTKCIYVPFVPLRWTDDLVERFKGLLILNALTSDIFTALTASSSLVAFSNRTTIDATPAERQKFYDWLATRSTPGATSLRDQSDATLRWLRDASQTGGNGDGFGTIVYPARFLAAMSFGSPAWQSDAISAVLASVRSLSDEVTRQTHIAKLFTPIADDEHLETTLDTASQAATAAMAAARQAVVAGAPLGDEVVRAARAARDAAKTAIEKIGAAKSLSMAVARLTSVNGRWIASTDPGLLLVVKDAHDAAQTAVNAASALSDAVRAAQAALGASAAAASATTYRVKLTLTDGTTVELDSDGREYNFNSVGVVAISIFYRLAANATFDPNPQAMLKAVFVDSGGTSERRVLAIPVNLHVPSAAVAYAGLELEVGDFRFNLTKTEVLAHLDNNSDYYTQKIFQSLGELEYANIISQYKYEGVPLLNQVDIKPLALSGNYLIFKARSTDENSIEAWKKAHRFDAVKIEIMPLGTGGVFGEAVLGRANSAEKLDITRFWNWQDSPIPITAPEIAPLQAGSRATPADVRPGGLDPALVTTQAPAALPGPSSAAILGTLATANMFRDMSGIAQTAQLAQQSLEQAMKGATATGQMSTDSLKEGLSFTKDLAGKVIQMTSDYATLLANAGFGALTGGGGRGGGGGAQGGGGGSGSAGSKSSSNLGNSNPSTAGAAINHGKVLDAEYSEAPQMVGTATSSPTETRGRNEQAAFDNYIGGSGSSAGSGGDAPGGPSGAGGPGNASSRSAAAVALLDGAEKFIEIGMGVLSQWKSSSDPNADLAGLMKKAVVEEVKKQALDGAVNVVERIPCGAALVEGIKLGMAFAKGAGTKLLAIRDTLGDRYESEIRDALSDYVDDDTALASVGDIRRWQLNSVASLKAIARAGIDAALTEAIGDAGKGLGKIFTDNRDAFIKHVVGENEVFALISGTVGDRLQSQSEVLRSLLGFMVKCFVLQLGKSDVQNALNAVTHDVHSADIVTELVAGLCVAVLDLETGALATALAGHVPDVKALLLDQARKLYDPARTTVVPATGSSPIRIEGGVLHVPSGLWGEVTGAAAAPPTVDMRAAVDTFETLLNALELRVQKVATDRILQYASGDITHRRAAQETEAENREAVALARKAFVDLDAVISRLRTAAGQSVGDAHERKTYLSFHLSCRVLFYGWHWDESSNVATPFFAPVPLWL